MSKKAIDTCSVSVRAKFKDFTSEEIEFLTKRINDINETSIKTGKDTRSLIKDFLQQQEVLFKQQKVRRIATLEAVERNSDFVKQSNDPATFLRALMGDNTGSREQLPTAPMFNNRQGIEDSVASVLSVVERDHPGTLKRMQANDKTLLRAIGAIVDGNEKSLADLNMLPEELAGAKALASAIRKSMDQLHEMKTTAGFSVFKQDAYMGRQRYPSENLKNLGPDKFREIALERVKFAENLSAQDQVEIIDKLYFNRLNDPNRPFWEIDDDMLKATKLKSGARIEKSRSVQFKSTEDFLMFTYDTGQNYFKNIINDYAQDSGEISAAMAFGPDYRMGFEKALQDARNRSQELGTLDKWKGQEQKLRDLFEFAVKGKYYVEENMTARLGRKMRMITNMSKLSSSWFATFPDLGMASGVLSATTGDNIFSSTGKFLKEHVKNFFGDFNNGRDVAARVGVFMDDMLHEISWERYGDGVGQGEGFLDKGHHFFMKATGLSRSDQAGKRAIALNLARHMAEVQTKPFHALPENFQNILKRYSISEKNWDILKNAIVDFEDGTRGISVESVRDMSLDFFPQESVAAKKKARMELTGALASYYRKTAEMGIPTTSLSTKQFLANFDPNSVSGQAMRMVMQFKSLPISVLKSMDYVKSTGGGKYGNIQGLMTTSGAAITAATLGFYAKKWAIAGKSPDDVGYGPKQALDVLAYSGIAGLYGDVLFSDRAFLEGIAGPTLGGSISDFMHVAQQSKKAAMGETVRDRRGFRSTLGDEAIKAGLNITPSIPYVKNALTIKLLDEIKEQVKGL